MANPAAAQTGLPPNVEPWAPGCQVQTDSRARNALVRNHIHHNFDIHRSLQCIAVQFAIALHRMSISEIQQRSRNVYRQIDGCALHDFVEIHISSESAGIARTRGGLRNARSDSDTAKHRPQRNRVVR